MPETLTALDASDRSTRRELLRGVKGLLVELVDSAGNAAGLALDATVAALSAKLPTALGPATPANSLSVAGAISTSITYGQTSVNGTAAKVSSSTTNFKGGFYLTNLSTSADPIFYGDASVTTSTGDELPAGQKVFVPIADASTVYAICAASGTTKATFAGFP